MVLTNEHHPGLNANVAKVPVFGAEDQLQEIDASPAGVFVKYRMPKYGSDVLFSSIVWLGVQPLMVLDCPQPNTQTTTQLSVIGVIDVLEGSDEVFSVTVVTSSGVVALTPRQVIMIALLAAEMPRLGIVSEPS